jgi:hypothetical protein
VVETCRRGRREFGLCHSHAARWRQQGRVDLARWVAESGGDPLPGQGTCRFPGCELDAEGAAGLCVHHRSRWIRGGRPPVDFWLLTCATFGRDRFDLRRLPTPMRLEVAYAIQCRVDERRTKTRPDTIRRLLRRLPGGGVDSLLDRSLDSWIGYLEFSSERGSGRAEIPARRDRLPARSGRRNGLGCGVSARCVAAAPARLSRS